MPDQEVIDLAKLAQGRAGGLNHERVVQRMGIELGQAAARIYYLLDQVEALQTENATLRSAFDEATRKLMDARTP